jgi:glycosyltransferase involved in cell wall biosynthesis
MAPSQEIHTMEKSKSHPRIVAIQPALPSYRLGFFSSIAARTEGNFIVYASETSLGVLTEERPKPAWLRTLGKITSLFPGAEWQHGAMSVPLSRCDILVVSGNPRCISNILLLLRARAKGIKTIWWGQLWSATTRKHRFLLRLLIMRLAHSVLFYTDAEIATYRASRWGRRDRRPLGALNNGIDVEPIKPLRRRYEPDERDQNILFIGRLTEKAELGLLLRAMTEPELLEATLHVIGDGPEAAQLKDRAKSSNLDGRVIWHPPTVKETQISLVANGAAVFCYPGAVGLSLIHAMAYGLPTVVHDHPLTHMPEIAAFEKDVTGLTFAKSDSRSLARSVSALLKAPDRRSEMSKNAQERADQMYNTTSMAERFLRFVENIR